MKLCKDATEIVFRDPVGLIESVCVELDRFTGVALARTTPANLEKALGSNREVRGRPAMYAFTGDGLRFFPPADQDYEITTHYYPPLREQ